MGSKTFVLGDVHGSYKTLIQCFERSRFDYAKDRLIVLGDVCDGYPQTRECFDELLKVKHCDYIIGNHDLWALDWAVKGVREADWLSQGGKNTIASYDPQSMSPEHVRLLRGAHQYLEVGKKLFVHGGVDPNKSLTQQNLMTLVWDRDLITLARKHWMRDQPFSYRDFEEIYVGHTTTQSFHTLLPLNFGCLWMLDTGAGWSGKLTIMDIDSKEYWQSDLSPELYPGFFARADSS